MGAIQIAAVAAASGLLGCGGDRQDKGEKAASYRVEVAGASFPKQQSIAQKTRMRIRVRNADTKALPEVAVTVATQPGKAGGSAQAFGADIANPDVADASRPIWIVDKGPMGGETAVTNTWALGPLKAGETKTFKWALTPVKPGDYTIDYVVSPSLTGKATAAAGRTKGSFTVNVSDVPPDARVGDDGEVITTPGKG